MHARSKTIVVVSAVLGFLATVTVGLRFWARHIKRTKFGFDDVLLLLALALTLGVVAIDIVGATWSRIGEHEIYGAGGKKLLPWEIKRMSIFLFSMEILHTCAMPAVKAYTLVFYLRIFVSPGFRKAVYVVQTYVFCWWVAVLFATIFQCRPVKPGYPGKCFDALTFFRAAAVLNVVSDVAVIILPIPAIIKLQMPVRHKVAIVGIFLTSTFVIVAGIGRTVSFFNVPANTDFSYHDYYTIVWTSIEPCMGIIGASLPSCRPIFKGFSPESLVGSIRSALSLRSMGSRDNNQRGKVEKGSERLRGSSIDGNSGKSLDHSQSRSNSEIQPMPDQFDHAFELNDRERVAEV